jgi:ABC-type uncharacterized transport system permease subunit
LRVRRGLVVFGAALVFRRELGWRGKRAYLTRGFALAAFPRLYPGLG